MTPWILLSFALTACTLPMTMPEETDVAEETETVMKIQEEVDYTETLRKIEVGFLGIGKERAPVLTVFTEYHSPYSMEFQRDFMPRLHEDFIDQNDLHVRFITFPLKKYPNSEDIAKGMICALSMEKGLQMHEILTLKQEEKRLTSMYYIEDLEIDPKEFAQCLESEEVQQILDNQKSIAEELGIERVPTFFFKGEKKVGLPYYADLRGWIKEKL